MPSLKGSRTEKNLLASFAGESQARNRYTYFSKQAREEGYVQIANIFEETANHEKEHAKRFFKFLEGNDVEITASYPAGKIGITAENLRAAAAGEHHEHSELYPTFAKIAKEEGFSEVAATFEAISNAEKYHERRYAGLLKNIETNNVFKKDKPLTWVCQNCGYNHTGNNAPNKCPACLHAQAHFQVLVENW